MIVPERTHTHTTPHTHTHTNTTHQFHALLTWQNSWYFIEIKYSDPNSAPRLCVILGIRCSSAGGYQHVHCIAAGAPFWIGGELPVFVVRPHAPNWDVRNVMVRYEYMYRATPSGQVSECWQQAHWLLKQQKPVSCDMWIMIVII